MSGNGPWKVLLRYLRPLRLRVGLLSLTLIAVTAAQLVAPQVLRYYVDAVRGQGPLATLYVAGILFVSLSLASQGIQALRAYLTQDIAWAATNSLRSDLAMHLLSLDAGFHARHTPGELIERVDGDAASLAGFLSSFVVQVVGNVAFLSGVIVILALTDWRIGSGIALLSVVALVVGLQFRRIAVPAWRAAREASTAAYSFVGEHVGRQQDIVPNGALGYVGRGLHSALNILLRRFRRARMTGNATFISVGVFLVLSEAFVLLVSIRLFLDGALSLGTVFAVQYYVQLLAQPIDGLARELQDLHRATASVRRIQDVMNQRSEIVEGAGFRATELAPTLDFVNVTFAYDVQPVLQDVTFSLPAGQVLGIIGRTGSGKTTVANLMLRRYDVSGGRVLVDGQDVRTAAAADIHQLMGIVTQHIEIFHASVRDNVSVFRSEISDDRIQDALRQCGLWAWYSRLPKGLDTLIGTGQGLSVGEAQLISIARLFVRDPKLVILDEASSKLDRATELRLEHAVSELLNDRTGVIVAHKPGLLRMANMVLTLESGRVVEFGQRAELIEDPSSRFRRYLRLEDESS